MLNKKFVWIFPMLFVLELIFGVSGTMIVINGIAIRHILFILTFLSLYGYTAYYTMDGSTPTTASSKYYGPIDMPEHNTLFKAILVNSAGRSSGVTTRNYILDLSENE